MRSVVFHIITSSAWAEAQRLGEYVPARYGVEGFIHLSEKGQILRPANLLYKGQNDLQLLVIDTEVVDAEIIYEPGSHGEKEFFPHLYGPLNLNAVVGVVPFPGEPDGSFRLPNTLDDWDS